MGKIFGISDLPVSTIMSPFEPVYRAPVKYDVPKYTIKSLVGADTYKAPDILTSTLVKARQNVYKLMKGKKI